MKGLPLAVRCDSVVLCLIEERGRGLWVYVSGPMSRQGVLCQMMLPPLWCCAVCAEAGAQVDMLES